MTRRPALRRDERGIAAVEFAMILPAFVVILMGGFDIAHTLYTRSVLEGTVLKAARDSSLETGTSTTNQSTIDTRVTNAVRDLNSQATVTISRQFFQNFTTAQAKQPEDISGDGVCSTGEQWIDRNFNNVYDATGGSAGSGGAKDIVVYTVTMTYPRLFPLAGLIGLPSTVTLRASTTLANQPYGEQAQRTGSLTPRNCP
jgi:Flp pilus assembly protein TadG